MNIKNINLGKIKFFLFFYLFTQFQIVNGYTDEPIYFGTFVDVKILDKLSSKNKLLQLKIGEDYIFKNLNLKVLKCKNSEFDDNPEITSYLQVRDLNNKDNNEVFVFNGWTFSSSPSIQAFDHPVYDLWILRCY
ncbi:DUF2155 domain-containing protein [Candidatus Pelagibacter sp.]|nr:DUF2155 domain-containing protein [Candidatus Pelagibacter sp.]|tara:strand:+ start:178 stop:579 length:402 start_codon:yes stop_codon:yes gene_type:complete